jgi:hypothetical protein
VNPRAPSWGNPMDILAWLTLLHDVVGDFSAAAEDITRPEDERTLGRLAARETILASVQMAKQMLALGISSLTEEKSGAGLN